MSLDSAKAHDFTYFERHKYRVASGLNSVGQEIWEANGFGKRYEIAATESKEEVEVKKQEGL